MKTHVALLASHHGSNLRALYRASCRPASSFDISIVISNNRDSGALAFAKEKGIEGRHLSGATHPDPQDLDRAIADALAGAGAALVVTAGYLRKLGPCVLERFAGRILNIHPSLLPRYGGQGMYGQAVHAAVLANHEPVSGATVHLVTAEYDDGPVIAQRQVDVLPEDTCETLAARVLEAEHVLLPEVVDRWAAMLRSDPQALAGRGL